MKYRLLDMAPKDHWSDDFLQFLRENNELIEETAYFLVIANCKYDKPKKRWFTAFWKIRPMETTDRDLFTQIGLMVAYPLYRDMNLLIKPISRRSVMRPHVHFYQ